MALSAADTIDCCWDLLSPQPDPEPAPKKSKNVYKMNSAQLTIGHSVDSYTYPLAITDRTPRLLDRSVMIDGIEYQVVDVRMEHRTPVDFGRVSRGGAVYGDEITIRARRI